MPMATKLRVIIRERGHLPFNALKQPGAEGIPRTEIAETFEDLTAFMAGEIEEANNREVARLAAKDD
jgi:hypothetical protein